MRYVAVIFVLVGAMFWVGADNFGIGDPTIDAKAQTSACVIKSDAGDTACSSVAAAVLASLDDGDQDGMQRAAPLGVVLTSQSATSPTTERGKRSSEDTQRDFDSGDIASMAEPDKTGEDEIADYKEPQYIGEFIDPDAEYFGLLTYDGTPEVIGQFIDPDTEEIGLSTKDKQTVVIGEFIDPNTF